MDTNAENNATNESDLLEKLKNFQTKTVKKRKQNLIYKQSLI